eukprot:TRINITY_DN54897_c0_g1_i1.p1 TRINITY_DN54897_c0_g1~~TRINITY_DN54897_c0_g1_i1.p1  ORF type:complete len:546 (-),score=60.02 TRINITY_DN54897_c0_g1_i1:323-1960(-)
MAALFGSNRSGEAASAQVSPQVFGAIVPGAVVPPQELDQVPEVAVRNRSDRPEIQAVSFTSRSGEDVASKYSVEGPEAPPAEENEGVEDLEAQQDSEAGSNRETPEKSGRLCVVCQTEDITTVAIPCRHSTLCDECSKEVWRRDKRCPVCRTEMGYLVNGVFKEDYVDLTPQLMELIAKPIADAQRAAALLMYENLNFCLLAALVCLGFGILTAMMSMPQHAVFLCVLAFIIAYVPWFSVIIRHVESTETSEASRGACLRCTLFSAADLSSPLKLCCKILVLLICGPFLLVFFIIPYMLLIFLVRPCTMYVFPMVVYVVLKVLFIVTCCIYKCFFLPFRACTMCVCGQIQRVVVMVCGAVAAFFALIAACVSACARALVYPLKKLVALIKPICIALLTPVCACLSRCGTLLESICSTFALMISNMCDCLGSALDKCYDALELWCEKAQKMITLALFSLGQVLVRVFKPVTYCVNAMASCVMTALSPIIRRVSAAFAAIASCIGATLGAITAGVIMITEAFVTNVATPIWQVISEVLGSLVRTRQT